MVTGLIGKKVGMTQLFTQDGVVHPATVLQAGPCVVSQVKTAEKDGYEAVPTIGSSRRGPTRRTSRPRGTSRRQACRRRACGVRFASKRAAIR